MNTIAVVLCCSLAPFCGMRCKMVKFTYLSWSQLSPLSTLMRERRYAATNTRIKPLRQSVAAIKQKQVRLNHSWSGQHRSNRVTKSNLSATVSSSRQFIIAFLTAFDCFSLAKTPPTAIEKASIFSRTSNMSRYTFGYKLKDSLSVSLFVRCSASSPRWSTLGNWCSSCSFWYKRASVQSCMCMRETVHAIEALAQALRNL